MAEAFNIGSSDIRSMIRVGPAGYPVGSKGGVDAVERVAAAGFSALEVQFVRQAKMAEEKARALGERAKELDIMLSAHAPYYINFNSPNDETARKSSEWILKTARIAHNMGAWVIVCHVAAYAGKLPSVATKKVTKGVGHCVEVLEGEGIRGVMIGLETMGKKGSWGTLDEISKVMDSVDGVVPVLDLAHLHARSGGGLRTVGDFEKVLGELEAFYSERVHCHFSSIEYTAAGERRHLDLGRKDPDFSMFAEVIKGKQVTVISETPVPEEGASEMLKILARTGKGKVT